MTKEQQKTQDALHDIPMFKVSPHADMKILQAIEDLHAMQKSSSFSFPSITAFFSSVLDYFDMSKWLDYLNWRRLVPACAVFLVIFSILFQGNFRSYDYHLGKAKIALTELEDVLEGRSEQISFIPVALAESGEKFVNENLVARLTAKIIRHTEAAIEAAEELDEIWDAGKAFSEISTLQKEALDVFSDAIVLTESGPITQTVARAIQTTVQEQGEVEELVGTFEKIVKENKPAIIVVEVKTSGDKEMKKAREEAKAREEEIQKAREEAKEKHAPSKTEGAKASGNTLPALPKPAAVTAKQNIESVEKFVTEAKTHRNFDQQEVAKMEQRLTRAKEALNKGEHDRAEGLAAALEAGRKSIQENFNRSSADQRRIDWEQMKGKFENRKSKIENLPAAKPEIQNPNTGDQTPEAEPASIPATSGKRINFEAIKENQQKTGFFSRWLNKNADAQPQIGGEPITPDTENNYQHNFFIKAKEKSEKPENPFNRFRNPKPEEVKEESVETEDTQGPPAEEEKPVIIQETPAPAIIQNPPILQPKPFILPKLEPGKSEKKIPKLPADIQERFKKARERLEESKKKKLEEMDNQQTGTEEESDKKDEETAVGQENQEEGEAATEETEGTEDGAADKTGEPDAQKPDAGEEWKGWFEKWRDSYRERRESSTPEPENQPDSSGGEGEAGTESGSGGPENSGGEANTNNSAPQTSPRTNFRNWWGR